MLTLVFPARIWAMRSSRVLTAGFVCGLMSASANEPEIVTEPLAPFLIAVGGKGTTTGPAAVVGPRWMCAAVALPDSPDAVILYATEVPETVSVAVPVALVSTGGVALAPLSFAPNLPLPLAPLAASAVAKTSAAVTTIGNLLLFMFDLLRRRRLAIEVAICQTQNSARS